MTFPLQFRFKILALANQIYVTDNGGQELIYVKQKMFKLRESIEIFKDSSKSELLYTISADKIIDFSPTFTLTGANGQTLGTIKRNGRRSLWKADYDLTLGDQIFGHIREVNPWAKVGDALFGEIPIIGLFAGLLFHPRYKIVNSSDQDIAEIKKLPAFLEGKYTMDSPYLSNLDDAKALTVTALVMMVILMERTRG